MTEYAISFYSEMLFVVAIAALWMAVWVRRKPNESARYLVMTMLTIAWNALCGAIEAAALTPGLKFFWAKIAYIGGVATPVTYFLFVLDYCHAWKWLTPRRIALICIPSVLTLAAAFTNDLHHLVWPALAIDPVTHLGVYQHGPFFWGLLAYAYILVLVGLGLLARTIARFPPRYRGQVLFTMAGWAIPFLGSLVYLSGTNPIPGLDWSLVGYMLASAVLSTSLAHVPLFGLIPLARGLVIENMRDGILVIDPNGLIADSNPATGQILGLSAPIRGEPAESLARFGIAVQMANPAASGSQEIRLSGPEARTIEVSQTQIQGEGEDQKGALLILRDITLRKRAEESLQELNRDLEGMVAERTALLQDTVHRLEEENQVRVRVEQELTALRDSLVDRVLDQGRHLSAIYDIILSGGQSTDPQPLMARTLEKIGGLFQCDGGCIHQHNEATGLFHLLAGSGLDGAAQRSLGTLAGEWWQANTIPTVSRNVALDETLPAPLHQAGYTSLVTAPIQLHGQLTGILTLFWKAEKSLPVDQIALFTVLADQAGMMMENIRLQERIEQTAVHQERRRLARDLHDSVTQSLHSLVLSTETANYRLSQGKMERLGESLAHIAESARQALKDMRLLLYELRLVKLEEIHLEEAIETRLESVERRTGIHAEIRADRTIDWPPGWQGQAYAVVMEALNNSLKHARATAVTVETRQADGKILVCVEDDGVGFDPQNQGGGIGLKSMAERAELLGGSLEIDSQPGCGARIRLCLDPQATPQRKALS
jgi:nitrate/nitrite-specific signal transduction histidine kinase